MTKHIVTFVISAEVDIESVDVRDDAKVQAIVGVFRGHVQTLEGQLDLLELPHFVKATILFDDDPQPTLIHKDAR